MKKLAFLIIGFVTFVLPYQSCATKDDGIDVEEYIPESDIPATMPTDSTATPTDTTATNNNNSTTDTGTNNSNNNHESTGSQALSGDGIRVGTYNVGHFNNGKLGGYQGDDVATQLQKWKEWIKGQALDILALNEWNLYFDKNNTINATEMLLTPFYESTCFGSRGAWIYNAFACNYETSKSRQITWCKSMYNAVIADVVIDGKTITILSTHMPWQEDKHQTSLDELIEELKQHEYFICFGDMNATDEEQKNFTKHGFHIANGGAQGFFKTYEGKNNVHLDNIITSGNITIVSVVSSDPKLSKGDHYPLEAILKIN